MTQPRTLPQAFQRHVAERPDTVAIRTLGGEMSLTWGEYGDQVRRIAGGLAGLGLERGDVFAALLTNRPEFNLTEMAANHLGATTFSIYNTCAPEQIHYLLAHSGAKVLVTEQQYVDKVNASGAKVDHVLVIEHGDLGGLVPASDFDFESVWNAVPATDVLCMIYTSGTTGPPKGVEHTHAGVLGMARAFASAFPIDSDDVTISYLPSAHGADRCVCNYFHTIYGAQVVPLADLTQLSSALAELHPTTFAAVPRVWEKLKIGAELTLAANERLKTDFDADHAQAIGAVRTSLGFDRVKWAVSGSAGIKPDTYQFLVKLGLPVSDTWGMSEVGVAVSAPPDLAKPDTVGIPLPGYEIRLLGDGELLIRATFMMRAIRRRPPRRSTRAAGCIPATSSRWTARAT